MDIKRPDLFDLETRMHAIQTARLIEDARAALECVKEHILANPAGVAVRSLLPLIQSISQQSKYLDDMCKPAPWEAQPPSRKPYTSSEESQLTVTD